MKPDPDEITQTRFEMPQLPASLEAEYFAQVAKGMGEVLLEVRGYRADIAAKMVNDDIHWKSIQNEIAGLRHGMDAFQNSIRLEIEREKRESGSRISLIAAEHEGMKRQLAELTAKIDSLELRERGTMLPPPRPPVTEG